MRSSNGMSAPWWASDAVVMMRAGALALSRSSSSVREQERRKVVEGPGQLDAVGGQLSRRVHGAGVVDEDVELGIARQYLGGQLAHGRLRREVGDERATVAPPLPRPTRAAATRVRLAAADDRDVGAERSQGLGRSQADAVGGAGDQDLLAVRGCAFQWMAISG